MFGLINYRVIRIWAKCLLADRAEIEVPQWEVPICWLYFWENLHQLYCCNSWTCGHCWQ